MSETVYLLGSGVNRGLTNTKGLKPPLDGDFFQLLADQGEALPGEAIPKGPTLPHYRLLPGGAVPPLDHASDAGNIYWVYDFIQRFWHKTPQDLAREPFSLEELLTFLQLKREEARNSKSDSQALEYLFCELVLEHRLLIYLSEFSDIAKVNEDMARFGRAVYEKKSTVITTNYDTIMEAVIEQTSKSSGNQNVPPWSARDSYRFRFKEPELKNRASRYVRPLVLKLHGSLNWGSFISVTKNRPKTEKLVFYDRPFREYLDLSRSLTDPQAEKWLYAPLIVPMILYKDVYYKHSAIKLVWSNARKELSDCRRLVVIGYSFPPTDFHVKKLLLDGLFERDLKELVVVNPNTGVVQRIKDITHFQKPVVVCRNIGEFFEHTG